MATATKPRTPGAWYETGYRQNGTILTGVLVPTAQKAALFDVLYDAGFFAQPQAQAREIFLRMPPGRPMYLPQHVLEKIQAQAEINPEQNGCLYRSELEAHNALSRLLHKKSA